VIEIDVAYVPTAPLLLAITFITDLFLGLESSSTTIGQMGVGVAVGVEVAVGVTVGVGVEVGVFVGVGEGPVVGVGVRVGVLVGVSVAWAVPA
jgi:hypothetical protein